MAYLTRPYHSNSLFTPHLLVSLVFSSRRRHTRWNCDWSSDVCSSDLCNRALSPKPRASTPQESLASGPHRPSACSRLRAPSPPHKPPSPTTAPTTRTSSHQASATCSSTRAATTHSSTTATSGSAPAEAATPTVVLRAHRQGRAISS